jgi:hypothetical protein
MNSKILEADPSNSFYFTIDFAIDDDPERPLYFNAGWMMGFRKSFYTINYTENTHQDIITASFSPKEYNWYIEGESSYGSNIQNYIYLENFYTINLLSRKL